MMEHIYANGHVRVQPCVAGWAVIVTSEAGRPFVHDTYRSQRAALKVAKWMARELAS